MSKASPKAVAVAERMNASDIMCLLAHWDHAWKATEAVRPLEKREEIRRVLRYIRDHLDGEV